MIHRAAHSRREHHVPLRLPPKHLEPRHDHDVEASDSLVQLAAEVAAGRRIVSKQPLLTEAPPKHIGSRERQLVHQRLAARWVGLP